jgi:hypothetical protein
VIDVDLERGPLFGMISDAAAEPSASARCNSRQGRIPREETMPHATFVLAVAAVVAAGLASSLAIRSSVASPRSLIAFSSGTPGGVQDIYVVPPDGSGLRRLTHSVSKEFTPTWSSDGRWIAYRFQPGSDETGEIYVMRADGSGARDLTRNPAGDYARGAPDRGTAWRSNVSCLEADPVAVAVLETIAYASGVAVLHRGGSAPRPAVARESGTLSLASKRRNVVIARASRAGLRTEWNSSPALAWFATGDVCRRCGAACARM